MILPIKQYYMPWKYIRKYGAASTGSFFMYEISVLVNYKRKQANMIDLNIDP